MTILWQQNSFINQEILVQNFDHGIVWSIQWFLLRVQGGSGGIPKIARTPTACTQIICPPFLPPPAVNNDPSFIVSWQFWENVDGNSESVHIDKLTDLPWHTDSTSVPANVTNSARWSNNAIWFIYLTINTCSNFAQFAAFHFVTANEICLCHWK